VSENRVPTIIFLLKRDEGTGGWRRLHNEELHNFYASPNIVKVIKSRNMRWAGHVAHMELMKMHTLFWLENLKGRGHLKGLGIIYLWIGTSGGHL
jgi:hypothetical protein